MVDVFGWRVRRKVGWWRRQRMGWKAGNGEKPERSL